MAFWRGDVLGKKKQGERITAVSWSRAHSGPSHRLKELHKRDDDDKWRDKEWLAERISHRALLDGVLAAAGWRGDVISRDEKSWA